MMRKIFGLTLAGLLFLIPSLVNAEEGVSLNSLSKEDMKIKPYDGGGGPVDVAAFAYLL